MARNRAEVEAPEEDEFIQIERKVFEEFLQSLSETIESHSTTLQMGLEILGESSLVEEGAEEAGEEAPGEEGEINLDEMDMDGLLDTAERYGIAVSPRLRTEEQIRDFLYEELPKVLEGGEDGGEEADEEVEEVEEVEAPPPPTRRAARPAPPAPAAPARRAAPPAPARAKPVPPTPAATRSKLKSAVKRK